MRSRKGLLAKILSIPVLVACGFVIAAAVTGGGILAADSTPGPSPAPSTPATPTPAPSPPPTTPAPTPSPTSAPANFEGCGQGFWKNHPEVWTTYSPSDTVGSVFTGLPPEIASVTLSDALKLRGGGLNALMRQAVAALLNAAHADVDYALTQAQVVDMVNGAVAGGNQTTIASLTSTLETFNSLGAPGLC
jgi:hypothetical protein